MGRLGQGLALLCLSLILCFELVPFYWVFITSFKTSFQIMTLTNELWPTPWTLDQYKEIFAPTENFIFWFKNTILISLVTPFISTFVGALSGYGLARLRWRGSSLFSASVLIAYMTPGVLLLIPLLMIFRALDLLGSLGGLILLYPGFILPFVLWLMMGYYTSIPAELEDAGLIDGCTRFQLFIKVILPLAKPALAAAFLFATIHAWGEFLFAFSFLAGDRGITLPVGMAYMVNSEVSPWGELTAMTMIMAAPVVILYLMGQKFMVSGLTAGAVKGRG
jgi:multiple sugar transport system permease protein